MDKEYIYEGRVLISQTDLKGIITFANRKFCEVSGYTAAELIGSSHKIVRHSDMPKAVFEKIWQTISGGEIWSGILKNLRKDGLYYWVDTEILPVRNEENQMTGYIAVKKPASRKNINESAVLYKKMLAAEQRKIDVDL